MTFTGDFLDEEKLEQYYPSAFGITFTPQITGIALAVLGIVGAGYIYFNMVAPVRQQYQQVQDKQQQTEGQLQGLKTGDLQRQFAELNQELERQKALKDSIIAMFANESDLDTLLLDLNSFIVANQGKLLQYQPDSGTNIVQDSSLGDGLEGKLKRKGISLSIEGTFAQTKGILRDIERLQPLLLIKSINSTVSEEPTVVLTSDRGEIVPQQEAKLQTQIQLDAILPLTEEELQAAQEATTEQETQQ
ncbi:type II and III secretion system protein [Myxosarcina sp. GI1(2024)]